MITSRLRWLAIAVTISVLGAGVPAISHAAANSPQKPHGPAVQVPQGWPQELLIPKLGVKANIEQLSFFNPSDEHAPYRWEDVAWYDLGPKPGHPGRSVIFGHLDSYCCPAVFWHLDQLQYGDVVQVQYKTGPPLTFRVIWTHQYLNNELPLKNMYGFSSQRSLALATCAGIFHRDGTGYDHKVVVFTRLVLPNGQLG
jgi:Sortase domain